jgi:alpha-beta hydrolase superfamily lysophospholipase
MIVIDGQLISFESTDKLGLNGFLMKSKPKNKTLIIHIHGMGGNFYWNTFIQPIANTLKGSKYDLFTINTRGNGYITKFYQGKNKKYIGVAHEKIEESIFDVQGAINFAKKLGYTEFVLSGHSTGCQKMIYYQSKKQNKNVKAVILLAPGDDYSIDKKEKGKNFTKAVNFAKKQVQKGKGDEILPAWISKYSAKRYLSFADSTNTESQLLNYNGDLKHFSKIKAPVLAVFGNNDEYLETTAQAAFEKLREKTNSEFLETIIIKNTNHGFKKKESELAKTILEFLQFLDI